MRSFGISIIFWVSFPTLACFSGIGYEENWNESVALLWFSAALCSVSVLIRLIRKVDKLYIPVIAWFLSCIPSIIEILRYGYGDCGTSLMEMSTYHIYVMLLVVLYDTVLFIKDKFSGRNT